MKMERLVTMNREIFFLAFSFEAANIVFVPFLYGCRRKFLLLHALCTYHLGFLPQVFQEFVLLGCLCVNATQFLLSEKSTNELLIPLSIQHCGRVVATECLVRLSASLVLWKDHFVFMPLS